VDDYRFLHAINNNATGLLKTLRRLLQRDRLFAVCLAVETLRFWRRFQNYLKAKEKRKLEKHPLPAYATAK
jgi:hypothetical protein